jgi:phage gp46-like protein
MPAPRLTLRFDPTELDGDLADEADEAGVETEALIALGCDARVDASRLPSGVPNRGWWGDFVTPDGEQIGSSLWLAEKQPASDAAIATVEGLVAEALAPIVAAKRATGFAANVRRDGQHIEVAPALTLADGTSAVLGALRVN